MNTNSLKRFAREARIKLIDQVGRKLEFVLSNADPVFIDTNASQIQSLKNKIQAQGKEQVIDTVAYTWFNRLMALRFMDANGYTSPKVVTPVVGKSPEILQNALSGQIDENLKINRQRLNDLLDGKLVIADAQTEAYKMLLIASCNQWHTAMPFMFERISDYTELLLPDDLLSENSIITDIRNGMSDEDCGQEELIGWLYQFYIADKKDDVFEGLKKNIKITAENIPAATQLFTPRWIVRYMVENTLGKLWLTLKPNSKLRQYMPYYIEAPEGKSSTPLPEGIKGVTDITFLDPCQGSGHVLVYAFDLFTKIYEEEGYNTNEIPALILEHNLFGIDIDERAAQLAAFALTMKARSYYPRFLRKPVQPHVIALENVNEDIIKQAVKLPLAVAGKLVYDYRDLTLYNLTQADNFGSLIQIDPEELKALTIQKGSIWQEQEQKIKEQAEYLSRKYHCVVTNPPYMGGKGMNDPIKLFLQENYEFGKSDLFAGFILRCQDFICDNGFSGMVTMESWMFLSSFEELRKSLIKNTTVHSLSHFGWHIMRIAFGTCSFIIQKAIAPNGFKGVYSYLEIEDIDRDKEAPITFPKKNDGRYNTINQKDFEKIPGSPFGYWVSSQIIKTFEKERINKIAISDGQNITGNNAKYIRYAWEVEQSKIGPKGKWPLVAKGGEFRKWYGNIIDVIDWSAKARDFYRTNSIARIQDERLWFRKGITWNLISSGEYGTGFRILEDNCLFNKAAPTILFDEIDEDHLYCIIGFLNSKLCRHILNLLNPTYNTNIAEVLSLPLITTNNELVKQVTRVIEISKVDWNRSELSSSFYELDIIKSRTNKSIQDLVKDLFSQYKSEAIEVFEIEVLINKIIAKEYNLENSIDTSFSLGELTVLKNELSILDEINLNTKFIFESLISYSIGCIFGRYSLDKPGLILANQGETLQDFLKQIPNPSFKPDEDNIIPVLEGEWFTDDIVGRFKVFLRAAFGEEHFEENLKYMEDTIGKDIRKYFVKDFYNDHIKRYKKRPIYWMFSSPKGHFKALIYMHRYTPDLCSKMLTDYLQSYVNKLEAAQQNKIAESLREDLPARERTAATKEADRYSVMIKDCKEYAQTLYAVATKKITIDLDDGVKINYQKFKEVLVPIKGLEKDEE
jgi:type II restriction/modification system DNA methylase subunit YeeA